MNEFLLPDYRRPSMQTQGLSFGDEGLRSLFPTSTTDVPGVEHRRAPDSGPGMLDTLFGRDGYALPMVQTLGALTNAYLGMKQYGLAKSQLAQNKYQFGLNYDAQRSTINSQLEDRQRARVASNPGAYQSIGDYMGTYAIKPRG